MGRDEFSGLATSVINAESRRKKAVAADGWLTVPITFNVLAEDSDPHEVECLEVTIDNMGVTLERIGETPPKHIRWQDILFAAEAGDAGWQYGNDLREIREEINELIDQKQELEQAIAVLKKRLNPAVRVPDAVSRGLRISTPD